VWGNLNSKRQKKIHARTRRTRITHTYNTQHNTTQHARDSFLLATIRARERNLKVAIMGGAASKPGFPASSEERLDGDLLEEEEEEEEEEKYFSAQKVREKDDDDEEEEEMTTISETSSETQRAREEARDPGSATAKKSPREQKGRSSVSSRPRLLFTTTDDDDDDETKRKAKRGRSPSEEGEETPPKQSATTVKKSKMIEVAKFSTTKSSEIAKRRKKKTPDTPHLSVGLSVPASSKHRLELELKRLDAVTVATKLEFVGGPNYPTTRRSEQFKKHRLRSTSKRGKRGEHLPSSPATNMDWA